MSKLTKTSTVSTAQQEARRPTTPTCDAHAPVLITEHEVLFSTAAAVRAPVRHNVVTMMSGAMTSVVAHWHTLATYRSRRPYYPSRLSYLENSLMSREMDRL